MAPSSQTSREQYTIRQYDPGDREGVLSLYERVYGDRREAYFDWRFIDTPYAVDVPICVTERGGEIVGARPSLVVPIRVGGASVLAIMQVDPMVHPDHRGQGLFTRMVEHVYEHYADGEPAISIGFANEAVKSGLSKVSDTLSLSAGIVEPFPEYYRIQHPGPLVDSSVESRVQRSLARLAAPVARGHLAVRDRLAPADDSLSVVSHEGVPAQRLAALAAEHVPLQAHAAREEPFYRWRFDNPRYEYETYVATRNGEDVAAMVAGTRADDGVTRTHVSEALPLDDGAERERALSHLLGRLLDDHRDSDVVAAAGSLLPESVLSSHGFHDTTSFPLSRLTQQNYFVARPVSERDVTDWVLNGQPLADSGSWLLSMCEREIG